MFMLTAILTASGGNQSKPSFTGESTVMVRPKGS